MPNRSGLWGNFMRRFVRYRDRSCLHSIDNKLDGRIYHLVPISTSWTEADSIAKNTLFRGVNGALASVRSQQEVMFLDGVTLNDICDFIFSIVQSRHLLDRCQ
jgi:hypothetical protein